MSPRIFWNFGSAVYVNQIWFYCELWPFLMKERLSSKHEASRVELVLLANANTGGCIKTLYCQLSLIGRIVKWTAYWPLLLVSSDSSTLQLWYWSSIWNIYSCPAVLLTKLTSIKPQNFNSFKPRRNIYVALQELQSSLSTVLELKYLNRIMTNEMNCFDIRL